MHDDQPQENNHKADEKIVQARQVLPLQLLNESEHDLRFHRENQRRGQRQHRPKNVGVPRMAGAMFGELPAWRQKHCHDCQQAGCRDDSNVAEAF